MRVMVIGGGGREHALAWRLAQEDSVLDVLVAPGNAGTPGGKVRNVEANTIDGWTKAADEHDVDLTVVGPEQPLADGVTDAFIARGLKALGPTSAASQIESSKSYAKKLMRELGISTAEHSCVDSVHQARRFIDEFPPPYVVKADGLARGKATEFANDREEALRLVADYVAGKYGAASRKVVLERKLQGEEMSLTALCDGERYVLLPGSRDYKRLLEGDFGPNTGGMGAVSPSPAEAMDGFDLRKVAEQVISPVLSAMESRGMPFRGFLYAGLMYSKDEGAIVLEYNCRIGDPEAQVILPRTQGDLGPALAAAAAGDLDCSVDFDVSGISSVGVVLASEGYPEGHVSGQEIMFPEESDADIVFHAGTARSEHGATVVAGGRVACATSWRPTVEQARAAAYELAERVSFDGRCLRKDVAAAKRA